MTEQGRRPPRQEDSIWFPLRPHHEEAPGETEAGGGISARVRDGTDLRPHSPLCSPLSQAGDSQKAVPCGTELSVRVPPLLGSGKQTALPHGPHQYTPFTLLLSGSKGDFR